jgi:hypothetical protein
MAETSPIPLWRKLLQAYDRERKAVEARTTLDYTPLYSAGQREIEFNKADQAVDAAKAVTEAAIVELDEHYRTHLLDSLTGGSTHGGDRPSPVPEVP